MPLREPATQPFAVPLSPAALSARPPTRGAEPDLPDGDWEKLLINHAQDVLTAVDEHGTILYDSPAVTRVLGYPQGELVGSSALALIHPDDLPAALELLSITASGPGEVSSLVYRFRHRDGGWRFLESVGTAVDGSRGVTIVVSSRDVTGAIESADAIRIALGLAPAPGMPEVPGDGAPQIEMLERLARAAELRDDETGEHTRRVAAIASLLAKRMALEPQVVREVAQTAPLHDIGKIGIPDHILRKRGALTREEMRVMRMHTVLGGRILAGGRSPLIRTAERIAMYHHERWDGGGYPCRLTRDEIPIEARVVAVADFYDALTHDRPYRAAMPPETVRAEIRRGAGSHFDPDVVAAFVTIPYEELKSAPDGRFPASKTTRISGGSRRRQTVSEDQTEIHDSRSDPSPAAV